MHPVIKEIIERIPAGHYFDTHFVIDQFIQHHSDQYLSFAAQIGGKEKSTNAIHGQIAAEIKKLDKQRVQQITDGKSWSGNIHVKPSECTLWRKI